MQFDLLVRLGTVEQGMFEEKSLVDPDMKGELRSTDLEQRASLLSWEVRGETIEVAISDLATDEEDEDLNDQGLAFWGEIRDCLSLLLLLSSDEDVQSKLDQPESVCFLIAVY